jgi:chemotaxis family two-component system response regulator Rcp1
MTDKPLFETKLTSEEVRPIWIMMVDDSRSDIALTRRALTKARVMNSLVTAHDGAEALRLLDETASLPDVILLDLNMAGMDGRETLRSLKTNPRYRHIPVIILTSSSVPGDVKEAYANHCAAYVRKPLDMISIGEVVNAIRGFWLAVVQYVPHS